MPLRCIFPGEKRRAHAGAGGSPPGLYEREVLNDFVFPFVGRNAAACEGAYQPPALFPAAAGVKAHRVLDINDTAFISSPGHMDGVISCAVIRNSPPTMCAPSADAASCSGTCIRDLPRYRG